MKINDEPPTPQQVEACRPRLLEQIYLVDPILVVSLGAGAATALTGKSVSITREHGTFRDIEVPGVWNFPVVTDKKKQWLRKIGGQMVAPVSQHQVRYSLMMTLHPAYAMRFVEDKRQRNIFTAFVLDIQTAVNTYQRYVTELLGHSSAEIHLDLDEIEDYVGNL